jgi:hypothetical protein
MLSCHSKVMLLQHASPVDGARSLAQTAEYARSSAGTIQLRQALLATEDHRTRNHYTSLGESLAAVAKQKFNNVFTEVCLLDRGQVPSKTLAPLFQQLKEQEPALFVITESVHERFYRFVEDRGLLSTLLEKLMRGMVIRKQERAQLTMLELVFPEARKGVKLFSALFEYVSDPGTYCAFF